MIYVDQLKTYPKHMVAAGARPFGKCWCHLWTDRGNEPELHAIALRIGLRRAWYQDKVEFPHYDLTPGKRIRAIAEGAIETNLAEWLIHGWHKWRNAKVTR